MGFVITGASMGSLVIRVECDSPQSLEKLWEDYLCNRLDKMVQDLVCHWEDLEGTEPNWAEAENNNGWGRVQCMQSTF